MRNLDGSFQANLARHRSIPGCEFLDYLMTYALILSTGK